MAYVANYFLTPGLGLVAVQSALSRSVVEIAVEANRFFPG